MKRPPLSLFDGLFIAFFLVIILFMFVVNVYTGQVRVASADAKAGQPMYLPAPLIYLSVALLACIIGVIFKKRWARILSIIVLVFIALSSFFIIHLYFKRLSGHVDLFVLTFYSLPLFISLWYLYYFNISRVKEQFKN